MTVIHLPRAEVDMIAERTIRRIEAVTGSPEKKRRAARVIAWEFVREIGRNDVAEALDKLQNSDPSRPDREDMVKRYAVLLIELSKQLTKEGIPDGKGWLDRKGTLTGSARSDLTCLEEELSTGELLRGRSMYSEYLVDEWFELKKQESRSALKNIIRKRLRTHERFMTPEDIRAAQRRFDRESK